MKKMNHVLQVLMLSASLVASPFTYANEDKGLEIAQERKARDEGWGGLYRNHGDDFKERTR